MGTSGTALLLVSTHNQTQVWLWTQGRAVQRSLYQNKMMDQGMGLVEKGGLGHGQRWFYTETPSQTFGP